MTTLAVALKDGVVAIAADSMTVDGPCKCPAAFTVGQSKIIAVREGFMASAGSTADGHVLQSLVKSRPKDFCFTSVEAIFETFRKLHPILKEEYYILTDEDDDEQPYESSQLNVLIANPTGIYEVQGYREVIQYQKFWAIGSGWKFALGAMQALYDDVEVSAKELAERGVQVGCLFDTSSGLPVESFEIKVKKPRTRVSGGRAKPRR